MNDKAVLVLGATGIIGKAVCDTFFRKGYKPIIHFNSNKERAEDLAIEYNSYTIQANLAVEDEVDSLFNTAVEKTGIIHSIVYAAGTEVTGFLMMTSAEAFEKNVHTNLTGSFLVLRKASKVLLSQRMGNIVAVSSVDVESSLKTKSLNKFWWLRGWETWKTPEDELLRLASKINCIANSSWIVDKTENGWGEPQINNLVPGWEATYILCQKTKTGNLYFQSNNLENLDRGIGFVRSKFINGKYQEPEVLSRTINSKYLDYAFFVDPDEKFIIFTSTRPGGFTETDLHISYRQDNDSWSEAINLGEQINTVGDDGAAWPYISPDGKYLFFVAAKEIPKDFHKGNYTYADIKIYNGFGKIYWINTGFIEELKPIL